MALPSLSVVDPAVGAATIGMVLLALYYVVRQKLNRVYDAKVQLVLVYLCFLVGMGLEASRDFTTDPAVASAYTLAQVALILSVVMLLTGVSYTYYFRSVGPSFTRRVRSTFAGRQVVYGAALLLAGAYFAFVMGYLLVTRPFTMVEVTLEGMTIATPKFSLAYVGLLGGVLAFYVICPLRLFLSGASEAKDPDARRALVVLPLSWTLVGAVILVFNGLSYLDANLLIFGHAILALTFGVTALSFRNVRLLRGMFDPIENAFPFPLPIFTASLGIHHASAHGTPMLLEVEPSSRYETVVKDYVVEWQSRQNLVYVFTSASSPVMKAVAGLPELRLFVLSDVVSYAEPSTEPHVTLLPRYRPDVIADVTSKIIGANKAGGVSLVFDDVSPAPVLLGDQATLGLVRRMGRMLSGGSTTSLFLTTRRAGSGGLSPEVNQLFPTRLTFDSAGLREQAQVGPPRRQDLRRPAPGPA